MIKIKRTYLKNATTGEASVIIKDKVVFKFKTIELPWKDNEKQVSCIPAGTYDVVKRTSEKYDVHFHVTNVPDRDFILIHHGNYAQKKNLVATVKKDAKR